MTWWRPDIFAKKQTDLTLRMALIRALRQFFEARGYQEVETPALQVCPSVDTHVHGVKAQLSDINLKPERTAWLHTSPELAMKKLLIAGLEDIYQITRVYRDGDNSALHSPEFTMLEWYRKGADYRDTMKECQDLVRQICEQTGKNTVKHKIRTADPFLKWNIISVAEAFDKYVEIKLENYLEDTEGFAAALVDKNIHVAVDDRWDDLFFRVMAKKIEPNLGLTGEGQEAPCILYDYPACLASLAREKPEDSRFAERFEVYICGVELANGFSELTDPEEFACRFKEQMRQKEEIYGVSYPMDEDFLQAMKHGLPESSGVSLGVDRLAMLLSGADDIKQVLWTGKP